MFESSLRNRRIEQAPVNHDEDLLLEVKIDKETSLSKMVRKHPVNCKGKDCGEIFSDKTKFGRNQKGSMKKFFLLLRLLFKPKLWTYLLKNLLKESFLPVFLVFITLLQMGIFQQAQEFEDISWLLIFHPTRRFEVWRYITNMLLHKTDNHLTRNRDVRLAYNMRQEWIHGTKLVATVYILSQLFASLAQGIVSPHAFHLGSSGSEFGLLMINISDAILNNGRSSIFCLHCIQMFASAVIKMIKDLFNPNMEPDGIAHAGHVGGAIGGFLIGMIMIKVIHPCPWKTKLQARCQVIAVLLLVLGLVVNFGIQVYFEFRYNAKALRDMGVCSGVGICNASFNGYGYVSYDNNEICEYDSSFKDYMCYDNKDICEYESERPVNRYSPAYNNYTATQKIC